MRTPAERARRQRKRKAGLTEDNINQYFTNALREYLELSPLYRDGRSFRLGYRGENEGDNGGGLRWMAGLERSGLALADRHRR